jgi:hypothetical protein
MALHAIEALDDALDATGSFLTPVDIRTWLKLALVVFFAGLPGANVSGFQTSVNTDGTVPAGTVPDAVAGTDVWLLVGTVVAVAVLLGLVFLLVSSVMEFVLVESLRTETVAVRRYWGDNRGKGLRLFGFRLVLGAVVLGAFLLLVAPVLLTVFDIGPPGLRLSLALLVLLVPAFLLLALVAGLVNGFTTVFVVPVMLLEDCGVLAGWRRLWPTIVDQPVQYLAYAVLGFFLSAAGSIAVGVGTAIGAVVLLVPFGLLGAVGFGVFLVAEPAGIAVIAVVALLFVLAVLVVLGLAQVPVQTYLRYYALLVLGDIDPDLDAVPEQRAAARNDATGSGP